MRHFLCLCFFIVIFIIICYVIYFDEKDPNQIPYLNPNENIITFWSNDFHISPIHDLKNLLTPLGVRFIDKSLSGACNRTNTCAKDLQILTSENGMNPNSMIRKQFYDYYKNDFTMNNVDVFVCFHPAAMCELFMPFNRTILVIATIRYELGRFSANEWKQWNENLRTIASNPQNLVAANNLYDAEYIRYFTGINTTVLPSICAYTNSFYNPLPSHHEYIFIPSRDTIQFNQLFSNQLKFSLKKQNSSIRIKTLRELYSFYQYSDLAHHPAIIYLPYQISTMSLVEQYTMNIPLFFPSLNLLTKWHLKYGIITDRTWYGTLIGQKQNQSTISSYIFNSTIPDPNNEYDYSAIEYWLKYADFYQWPYITYFDSIDDLAWKLIHTNLTLISQQMSEYNLKKRKQVLSQWKLILERISIYSDYLKKTSSL